MRKGTTIRTAERLGRFTIKELAFECNAAYPNAAASVRRMHKAKMVHITAYIRHRDVCGHPVAVYQYGPGKDAQKPKAPEKNQREADRMRRKRAELSDRYGPDVARKITSSRNFGGADVIVIDGRVIYQRGPAPARFKGATE